MKLKWHNIHTIASRSFTCGYCGSYIASEHGYEGQDQDAPDLPIGIYICHKCDQPTYLGPLDKQIPGVKYGNPVEGVPDIVNSLYEEARSCTAANAFTASVLCSRKILMNIAVSKGAKEGESFKEYVNYLAEKGYIPPDGEKWVDHIREKGNEATHEISIVKKQDAEVLLSFVEMLLKFIFEFPETMRKKSSNKMENDGEN